MLGSADSGTLSPFAEQLADDPESAVIANAVTSEEVVATWRLPDLYAGDFPRAPGRFACRFWWKTQAVRR